MEGLLNLLGFNKDSGGDINKRVDDAIEYIKHYYQNTFFSVFGFIDSDSISYLHPFIHRGIVDIIRIFLKDTKGINYSLVDGCNVMINQPEYIDYMLTHNMKLSDIKRVNKVSYGAKVEKFLESLDLPSELGLISEVNRLRGRIYKTDKNCGIRDALKYSYEPLIIYGCGYNSLVRMLNEKYTRNNDEKYSYDYYSAYRDKVLIQVMEKISKNIEHFLSINSTANIVTLSSNISTKYCCEYNELIEQYNIELKKLCDNYSIEMVDSSHVNHIYYVSYYLAALILENLYLNKDNDSKYYRDLSNLSFSEDNLGMIGVMNDINRDYERAFNASQNLFGYDKNKKLDTAKDILDERRVYEKVLRRG